MAGDDPNATTEQPSSDGADDPADRPADRNAMALDAGLPIESDLTAQPSSLAPTVPAQPAPDPRTAARARLRAVRLASAGLARALMAAGYPPQRWQAPDPTLRELARDLPQPSLAALFARLDRFSGEDGPTWLAGGSAAIDAFRSEAHLLDGILRPLHALALRRRAGSPPDHPARPLERVLADSESGVELDRLAQAVDALVALAPALLSAPAAFAPAAFAPRLVPVLAPHLASTLPQVPSHADPPAAGFPAASQTSAAILPGSFAPPAESALPAAATPPSDAPTVIAADAPTIPTETPFMPGAVVSGAYGFVPVAHLPVLPDAPTVPWLPNDATVPLPPGKLPRPRPRIQMAQRLPRLPSRWRGPHLLVALAITSCLVCAVVSIVLTFAPVAGPAARATVATTARATQTRPLPTATLTPLPAQLAASPIFIALACPFTGQPSTLTLRDTGGASLTWRIASPPLTLAFSATSGSLAPGASAVVQVRAVWRQRGTHSFTVSSSGTNGANAGSVPISYTVCR